MNRKSTIVLGMAFGMFACSLTGCGSKPAKVEGTMVEETVKAAEGDAANNIMEGMDSAKGRYLESEIPLPEGVKQINSVRMMEDGTVCLLGSMEKGFDLWKSGDEGKTWEEAYPWPEELKDFPYMNMGVVKEDGSVFCGLSTGDGSSRKYVKLSPGGDWVEVPFTVENPTEMEGMTDCFYSLSDAEAGRVLAGMIFDEHIYLLDDTTGEILRTYNENEEVINFWQKIGTDLYAFSPDQLLCFDYETGKEKEMDSVLKKQIESDKENLNIMTSQGYPLVMCSGETPEELYYCNRNGIYRFTAGGSLIEQVMDGSLTSLSAPYVSLLSMQMTGDHSFLLAASVNDEWKLLRYRFDAEMSVLPEKELKVYSLEKNDEIEQAVTMFQTDYPDCYVNYEVGVTGEDAVTVSDALRTLNTEIMAGNGPDVLVLDGMPVDSYMAKGMLKDISSLYENLRSETELFEQITGTYQMDGAMYAVPTRFQVPVLAGEENLLNGLTDLRGFTETMKNLRSEDPDTMKMLATPSAFGMAKTWYELCSPSFIGEDGALNQEALTEFVSCMKELYDLNRFTDQEKEWMEQETGANFVSGMEIGNAYLLNGDAKVAAGELYSGFSYAAMCVINQQKQLSYTLPAFTGSPVYLPTSVAGITANSKETELAEAFVTSLLQEKVQSAFGNGFPVNKAAFQTDLSDITPVSSTFRLTDEDGAEKNVEINYEAPSEELQQQFTEWMDQLVTPVNNNRIVEDLVIEQTVRCLKGEAATEEAVGAILQKMELYLSEQG